jgi:hypothetical protein
MQGSGSQMGGAAGVARIASGHSGDVAASGLTLWPP